MGKFLTTLDVKYQREGEPCLLNNPLVFESEILGVISVPEGFPTDFASVPRIPIAYFLFGDTVHAPAVIHDYLYGNSSYPRVRCDAVFLEAMEAEDIVWWKRRSMWLAVRVFGWLVRSSSPFERQA